MSLRTLLKRIGADNAGATAVEYGLILALIALGMVGAANGLGTQTDEMWKYVEDKATAVL